MPNFVIKNASYYDEIGLKQFFYGLQKVREKKIICCSLIIYHNNFEILHKQNVQNKF